MGRVQADVPGNSKSANGAGAPAADDLLAQLAGDEVDRMLAEAEVEASPITTAPSAPGAPLASAGSNDKELTASLDALLKEMDQGETSTADAPAADADGGAAHSSHVAPAAAAISDSTTTVDQDATAASIDGLLDEIEKATPPPASSSIEPAIAESVSVAEAIQPSTTASSQIPAASENHGGTEADSATIATNSETAVTSPSASTDFGGSKPASAPISVSAAAASAPQASAEPDLSAAAQGISENDGPLPLYIRLLEILNSPLDALPDPIREAIGKIALVTLLNAIVVIGYVLICRRK